MSDVKSIYTKLDWYTAMFDECSISMLLDWLHLDMYQDEFVGSAMARSYGYDERIVYGFSGVSFETSVSPFIDLHDEDIFEVTFPHIRLNISGSGLDFLRSSGLDVDTVLRDVSAVPVPAHQMRITRADFAFDFVDYKSDLVDLLIAYCNDYHTDSNRVCLVGRGSGLSYKISTGSEKVVYFGSKNSKQLLRAYDKKMQYYDYDAYCYKKGVDLPYGEVDSWIRLELQTRQDRAHELLFGNGDMMSILKYIYESYCFAEYDDKVLAHRQPAEFWQGLFDWDEIPRIIRNFNFVQSNVSPSDQIAGWVYRNIQKFMLAYSKYGKQIFKAAADDYLQHCNCPLDLKDVRRSQRLLSWISALQLHPFGAQHGLVSDGLMLLFKE